MAKLTRNGHSDRQSGLAQLSRQDAAMRNDIHEVKEVLAAVATKLDCSQGFTLSKPSLFGGQETRIPLESAVPMVWSKSAAKDDEGLRIHSDFLKHWATAGLNAAVLETDIVDETWFTSREAVKRFQEKIEPNPTSNKEVNPDC